MSIFAIDTGPERDAASAWRIDRCDGILMGVKDSLPLGASQARIDAGVVAAVLGDLSTPKKAETVRRHLVQLWPLIAPLADTDPSGFDEVLTHYAEIITTLG